MSVVNDIKKYVDSTSSSFFEKPKSVKHYTSSVLSEDLFSKLSATSSSYSAIDGGSSPLYLSSSLAVFVIRVAQINDTNSIVHSFFATISLQKDTFFISYSSLDGIVPKLVSQLPVQMTESDSLFSYSLDVPIKTLGHFIRRLSELAVANQCESDVILLDGQVRSFHPLEKQFIEPIKKKIVGVVKTSRLTMQSGKSLLYSVSQVQTSYSTWMVSDLFIPDSSDYPYIDIVKLHDKSRYIFVCESFNRSLLSSLVSLSNDNTFLGYPYPLVKADDMARISKQESSYLQTRIMQQFDSLTLRQLEQLKVNQDSHDVLDSMKF